jgi:UDP-N-acetylglucosamine acyltransferase
MELIMSIHPSAIIDSSAELAANVTVAAHAVIGPHVRLGAGCTVGVGAVIEGRTTIGSNNHFHAHATIGGIPQDKKYSGEPTRLDIGNNNTFRECVTVNIGTAQDEGVTRIGSDNWIMAYVHIAHDCTVGNHTIMANATQLAGHVQVGDWAILGGITAVHQFCRIGEHAMTGAGTVLLQDLPPYVMAQGYPATPHGLNSEGLKRRGFNADDLLWLKRAYRALYRDGLKLEEAQALIASHVQHAGVSAAKVAVFADFIASAGRGFVR